MVMMAGGKLYDQVNQQWQRLTTQWERLTTLHRAFVLSGLVFLLSCIVTVPGLLSIYFLSILSALAVAKILNESNYFQPSDSLLKYVYFIVNFYFQYMSDLQKHWKKKRTDPSSAASEDQGTNENLSSTFKRHSQSSIHNGKHVTTSATASLSNEEIRFRTHIFNDFILSWYTSLSHHQQVPDEFLTHLKYLFLTFRNHSKQLNVHDTVNRILFELRKHTSQFRISSLKLKQLPLNSRSTLAEVYGHYFEIHQATQNQRFMVDYLRQVANLLMWFLLPSDIYRCYAGNVLLQEILTCNVFTSLVDLLSDPDTLNDIILLLIDDEGAVTSGRITHFSQEMQSGNDMGIECADLTCKVYSSQDVSKNKSSILTDRINAQEREELRKDSSDSDDQKVLQTSLIDRPKYLDFNDTKVLKTGSLPSHQGFPSSPTKPTLYRSKSSPVLSQPEQSTTEEQNQSDLMASVPLKKMSSLTSLVSFQSIPLDEKDSELWFLDGEENAQDGFVITKDPGPADDQLVLYNKHDAGFASDTIKMLHGMMDTALSKLPSMEVNPTEDDDEGDGVFSNLMENLKNWKTSIEDRQDELEDQFTDHDEPSSNGIASPEDDQSNWGHDFLKEQEKKSLSMLVSHHEDVTHQKKNAFKHSNSVATCLQSNGDSLGQNTADQKRAMYGASRSRTLAVVEDVRNNKVSDINKERSIWIQTMLIVDTETMKDPRNITKDYTLYIIKYQALIWKGEEHPKEPETHWLKRRFREFSNLQSRLDENPHLKPLLKGIKDVPRKLQLVNRMNEDVVLHRKHSLERYLQNLCSIPAICSSSEFQEFIALEGDTHIEFVKKAPELVPRIDKFFLRGMSGIMGTLKSKLPSSTALPANAALTSVDHQDSGQLDDNIPETPSSPFAELDTGGAQRSYVIRTRDNSVENNVDVLLKSFIESRITDPKSSVDKDQDTDEMMADLINITTTSEPIRAVFQHYSEDDKKELNYAEIPLADAVMCLLCEVLHDYGNWVVKETTQQIVAVAFGRLINKIIEDTVDQLVTEGMCARYLQLIREELWPNGQLLSKENAPKTDEEKQQSRRIAFQRVKECIPGVVTHGIGEEELENCLLFVHASLQDPTLNRHLVFTLIDILIDALLPAIHDLTFREQFLKEAAL